MNTITHSDIVSYLQNLVKQSVDIAEADFFRLNVSEIEGAMRTRIGYPCFALESHEGNFEGSKTNNSVENKMFAFSILKKPEWNNFDQETQYLDDCEVIGKKFLSRMRYDSALPSSILYNLFDASLVSYHKVGPIFTDQLYGYRFEVPLKPDKANLKVDPADWADIDSVC